MESDEHKRFYEDNSIGRTFAAKPDIRQKVLTSDAGDGNLLDNNSSTTREGAKIKENNDKNKFVIRVREKGAAPQ